MKGTVDSGVSVGVMRETTAQAAERMLLALDLVHKSGMIHLDIKLENIFIKNDQYKLGGFGLVSKIENHDDVEEGDSRYLSMELLSGYLDDLTKVSSVGGCFVFQAKMRDKPILKSYICAYHYLTLTNRATSSPSAPPCTKSASAAVPKPSPKTVLSGKTCATARSCPCQTRPLIFR